MSWHVLYIYFGFEVVYLQVVFEWYYYYVPVNSIKVEQQESDSVHTSCS